jgi:CheY-like chemotaxis protein
VPGLKLLHVEDSDADAYLFRLALEEANVPVAVFRVSDGEAGLRFLTKTAPFVDAPVPDIVILDLNMPRMNGLELLNELRVRGLCSEIPIVVLTTSRNPEHKKTALNLGARAAVSKPDDFGALIALAGELETAFLKPRT